MTKKELRESIVNDIKFTCPKVSYKFMDKYFSKCADKNHRKMYKGSVSIKYDARKIGYFCFTYVWDKATQQYVYNAPELYACSIYTDKWRHYKNYILYMGYQFKPHFKPIMTECKDIRVPMPDITLPIKFMKQFKNKHINSYCCLYDSLWETAVKEQWLGLYNKIMFNEYGNMEKEFNLTPKQFFFGDMNVPNKWVQEFIHWAKKQKNFDLQLYKDYYKMAYGTKMKDGSDYPLLHENYKIFHDLVLLSKYKVGSSEHTKANTRILINTIDKYPTPKITRIDRFVTKKELTAYGKQMANCVGSYDRNTIYNVVMNDVLNICVEYNDSLEQAKAYNNIDIPLRWESIIENKLKGLGK